MKKPVFSIQSNQSITDIENLFDWIVIFRVEMEIAAKKVTSLPGVITYLKLDILTPNKV